MKRRIIIGLIALILITAGVLVYFLFFREGELTVPFRRPRVVQPGPTVQPKSGLTQVSSFPISSFGLNPDASKTRFFERATGNLHEANFDGSGSQKISESVLPPNLIKVVWSKQWSQFAALFENQEQNFLYNFGSGRSTFFKTDVNSLDFAPIGSQIVYQSGNLLLTAPVTAIQQSKTVLEGAFPTLNLVWLPSGLISAYPTPSGLTGSFLILINQTNRVSKLLDNMPGLSVTWATDGSKMIFSHVLNSSAEPTLELANGFAQDRKDLKLKTLADKCAWVPDNKTIYCAVPDAWPQTALEPDDYYKGLVQPKDRFVKIDALTSLSNVVLDTIDADAQDLLITPQSDYLLFINRKDGKLYSLKL